MPLFSLLALLTPYWPTLFKDCSLNLTLGKVYSSKELILNHGLAVCTWKDHRTPYHWRRSRGTLEFVINPSLLLHTPPPPRMPPTTMNPALCQHRAIYQSYYI